MNKVWVVTEGVNDYNQYGDYFVQVYKEKPTKEQALELLIENGYLSEDQLQEYQDSKVNDFLNGSLCTTNSSIFLSEEELR